MVVPPLAVLVIVTPPVEALTEIPVPAVTEVTPLLVTVMPPVEPLTETPVPAVSEVTPLLVIVNVPDEVIGLPVILIPEPAVAATEVTVPTAMFPAPSKLLLFTVLISVPDTTALIAVPFPLSSPVMLVESVSAGVAPPELVPANPFAEATDTAVTVPPVPVAERVPAAKLIPVPIVTLLKPPALFPYKMLAPLVAGA